MTRRLQPPPPPPPGHRTQKSLFETSRHADRMQRNWTGTGLWGRSARSSLPQVVRRQGTANPATAGTLQAPL